MLIYILESVCFNYKIIYHQPQHQLAFTHTLLGRCIELPTLFMINIAPDIFKHPLSPLHSLSHKCSWLRHQSPSSTYSPSSMGYIAG